MLRGVRAGVGGAAVLLGLAGISSVQAALAPYQSAQDVARDLNLQQILPHDATPAVVERTQSLQIPALGDILITVATIAVLVGLAFAFWTIRDRLPALGRRKLASSIDPASLAASVENMVASQLEADELAGRGQLAEAIHTLLLRSLVEMRKTLGIGIPDSLTSREVLARVSLPGLGQQAFGDIIRRVELVYFGDRPADQGNYAACRNSYLALIASMRASLMSPVRG